MPKQFEITSALHEDGRIAFEWGDAGGTYHVYKEGEHLYEGTSTDFQDTDITPNHVYKYTIERHEGGEVKDVIVMQTSAFSQEKNKDNPLQSLVTTVIVGESQIALSWEHISNAEMYIISREGEEIGRVESNRFIDRDFPKDETITYAVYCERPIEQSKQKFNHTASLLGKAFGLFYSKKVENKVSYEGFTIMKTIETPARLLSPVSDRKALESVDHWYFRYQTFLEDDIVENPNVISPNRYFKGDNRGFDPDADSFRTRVDVELNCSGVDTPLEFTKEVGESVAYGMDRKERDRQTASDENVVLERADLPGEEVGFHLKHAVKNPLTTSPDINYEVQAVFKGERTFTLSGYHDQSPDHEIYLKRSANSRWIPVHQSRSEGLMFMSGVMPCQYWHYSNIT